MASRMPPLTARASLRWAVVQPLVARLRPAEILEVGVGQGAVGARLARLARYTGVEPDSAAWRVAYDRITPLGGVVLHGDHRAVPPGTLFDLVCGFEVLEHIRDDGTALAEWLSFARPGGRLLISVPADPHRYGSSDALVGHFRRYPPGQLRRLLTAAGATDVVVRRYGWPLCYLLEAAHHRVAAPRLGTAATRIEDRSAASGRFLQPGGVAAGVIRAAVVPFRGLQRVAPDRGAWLVAHARRPSATG